MRRTVARRAERSRSDFVCPGDVCKLWSVLSSSGMGRFWRIFVSTSRKSGGKLRQTVQRTQQVKSASQLNANEQLSVSNECSKDREERLRAKRERAAAEQAQTTSLPSLRGKPASLMKYGRSLLPAR